MSSIDAVTTFLRACRCAQIAPAMSITEVPDPRRRFHASLCIGAEPSPSSRHGMRDMALACAGRLYDS